jgi:hypothetical protein
MDGAVRKVAHTQVDVLIQSTSNEIGRILGIVKNIIF